MKPRWSQATALEYSIHDDPDYALLFEFNSGVGEKLLSANRKKSGSNPSSSSSSSLLGKKDFLNLVERLRNEINSLIVSEYFLNQASNVNIWSDSPDLSVTEDVDETSSTPPTTTSSTTTTANQTDLEAKATLRKVRSLKEKIKRDFIERNESLLVSIVDTMCRLDLHEFVKLGGLELLLLIYEKHKSSERFLNIIGNCLCLVSLEPKYTSLFVQSGR